ncbi:MAG TPA: L-threonylcarbamoyladenylate synthase, partial [Candidatus Methylomirabilis sp.]|nr:L-threonylcarbamoyladenylate synthase [Candidatus Methylomirabilis sp.]
MVHQAVCVLRRGGVIAFPTETTYGLGCDPRNTKAVARIFRIKGRPLLKALPLVVSSVLDVKRVAVLAEPAARLARRYWPGPLTLVLPVRRGQRFHHLVAPNNEVAIRVSSSPFVRALVRAYGFPIVATSANRSGQPECRSGRSVVRVFQDAKMKPGIVIDVGPLPRRR